MERPSPLPSVVLDTSPRTKRSVSSSGLILSLLAETFFIVKETVSSSLIMST